MLLTTSGAVQSQKESRDPIAWHSERKPSGQELHRHTLIENDGRLLEGMFQRRRYGALLLPPESSRVGLQPQPVQSQRLLTVAGTSGSTSTL